MKQKRIISIISLVSILVLGTFACSKSGTTTPASPAGGSTNAVSIVGMTFTPATLTVKAGTKVTWTNNDGVAHTVTSDDGTSFNSGSIASGGTFSFTPTVAGTYGYHCTIHSGMTATLVVTQ